MRSHISVHGATTKYFSNSFIFKNEIEKEGLPRDSPAGLGAGGPEFKSRRPGQFMFFVFHHLEMLVFLLAFRLQVTPTLVEHGAVFFLDRHYRVARSLHFVATSVFPASGLGLCQPPSPAMMQSASIGPQVLGS
jgi:hypothetical protein